MAREGALFSIIIPSTGRRPKALQQAVFSIERAARFAGLGIDEVEILIGFDGVKGQEPRASYDIRCITFPEEHDWGNGIRNMLMKIATGSYYLFVDDDNTIKPYTLALYKKHLDVELIIGRIDTQLAFDKPFIPIRDNRSLVRQGNVDPLCICVARKLALIRCGGWNYTGYPADYLNILDWSRRARSTAVLDDVMGVYDAGRNLDSQALSRRQQNMLDRMANKRAQKPTTQVLTHQIAAVG